jgi:hypothetical protein
LVGSPEVFARFAAGATIVTVVALYCPACCEPIGGLCRLTLSLARVKPATCDLRYLTMVR